MIARGDKSVELPQEVGRWFSSVPTDFLTFFHPAAMGLSNLTDPDYMEAGWA